MNEMAPWMRVLISVFLVSVKRQVEPERGNNRQGFVEQSSDENAAWHRDAVDRWRRWTRSCAQVNL